VNYSSRAAIQPGLKILARFEKLGQELNGLKNLKNSHVIKTEFQPGLKHELGHAFSAPFDSPETLRAQFHFWFRGYVIFQPELNFDM